MGPKPKFSSFSNVFRQNGNLPSPVDCALSPVLYNPVLKLASQLHRKYYFGQEEEEMKLCLMILSVPWYMFNGLEHTALLNHFLTFITGSSSRLLRIRISAAVTLYWFPVCHFWCKEFNPLVIWIWNQTMLFLPELGLRPI